MSSKLRYGMAERGRALTIWLIFMILANAWIAYRYAALIDDQIRHHDPDFYKPPLNWALPTLLALAIAAVVALLLILLLRKIGFYAFIAVQVAALIVGLILKVSAMVVLVGIIGPIILWMLLSPRRGAFR